MEGWMAWLVATERDCYSFAVAVAAPVFREPVEWLPVTVSVSDPAKREMEDVGADGGMEGWELSRSTPGNFGLLPGKQMRTEEKSEDANQHVSRCSFCLLMT